MLSNISVCPMASLVLTLVVIINILDIYLVGFQFAFIVTNLLISVFFVWLTNKTCDKYQWVSWLITAYFVICIIGAITIISNPEKYKINATKGILEGNVPCARGKNRVGGCCGQRDSSGRMCRGACCPPQRNGCCQ